MLNRCLSELALLSLKAKKVPQKERALKTQKVKACQKSLPFHEQIMVWQQIPADIRKEVIQLLTQMIRDYYHRKEESHVK
jgi:predicted Fe-S protein YdhL (DUF1289 family)